VENTGKKIDISLIPVEVRNEKEREEKKGRLKKNPGSKKSGLGPLLSWGERREGH